jgi:hypothetical protein
MANILVIDDQLCVTALRNYLLNRYRKASSKENQARILEFRIVRLISLIFFSFLGFSLMSPGALAEEKTEEKFERSGFWGGVDFGVGFVQRSFAGIEEDENNFFSWI